MRIVTKLAAPAVFVLMFLHPGCGIDSGGAVMLTVYAAASLRDAIEAAAPRCGREAGAEIVFNFAGTSTLARQITAANKADVFISADEDWMDIVERAGLVEGATRVTLVSNSLVVIAPADSTLRLGSARDLTRDEVASLALALPDAVPAGKYAREWLEDSGVWEELAGRIVPVADVRAALATVASGLVPAGIVYRTDAAISPDVRILFEIPREKGPRIIYPVAVMRQRPHLLEAQRLVDCLTGPEARRLYTRFGFVSP